MTEYKCKKGKVSLTQEGTAAEILADVATLITVTHAKIKETNSDDARTFKTALTLLALSGKLFETGDLRGEEPSGKLKEIIEKALKNDGE